MVLEKSEQERMKVMGFNRKAMSSLLMVVFLSTVGHADDPKPEGDQWKPNHMFTVPYDDYASSLVLAGYGKQYTEKLADEIILRFYPFLAAEKNSSSRAGQEDRAMATDGWGLAKLISSNEFGGFYFEIITILILSVLSVKEGGLGFRNGIGTDYTSSADAILFMGAEA